MSEPRFVHSVFAPLVAVVASDDADELAAANNAVSFAHLLQPFGHRIDGKVNVLDASGHSSNLDGFAIRFRGLRELQGPDLGAIRKVLVQAMAMKSLPAGDVVKPVEEASIKGGSLGTASPWYNVYRNYVCKFNGASEHETFNHPVACLVVVSTMCPDPIMKLNQLYPSSPDKLPPIFNSGYLDPQIPLKHYVLVHDASRAPNVDADALFAQMKKSFGLSCRLIRINSKTEASPEYNASKVWDAYMNEFKPLDDAIHADPNVVLDVNTARGSLGAITQSELDLSASVLGITKSSVPNAAHSNEAPIISPVYGALMTESDVKGLDTFVKEFVVQSLLPSMERSVQHWNEQVASSRRGFTGRLFTAGRRFLGTSAQTNKPAGSPGILAPEYSTPYPYTSQELILRRLADYSFMLHDYKFAYSMYDSVKKDFQGNDRAIKHFAGVQEMLALCVLMSDSNLRGNLESLLDSSISNYLESGVSIYATRATMLVYEMLKYRENYKDSANFLLRMIGEDSDLRSAILLEQSAFCHLKSNPPQRRKYAFYLVMAGDRFTKCGQKEHALRCYSGAQNVYGNYKWSLINDHNNFTIGRLHFHLGNPSTAFAHFTQLLQSSQQTATQQASHLEEFLHIFKSISTQRPIDEVEKLPQTPVPLLIQSSINVSLVQHQHMGQTSVADGVWDRMENDLVELGFNGKPGRKPVKLMKTVRDGGNTICAVGEPVFVSFSVKNPLQISLELTNVTLFARFTQSQANVVVTDPSTIVDSTRLSYEFFDLEYVPVLTLDPNEIREMQLRVFPKCEGELLVEGLKLTLSDCVPITIEFAKRGRRLNDNQKQRSGDPVYAVDNTLRLTVTSPMPVLDVLFHSFPETLLSGQVERTVLEVNNKGHRGLKNLKIKLSHASFFGFGSAEQIDFPSYTAKAKENVTSREVLTSNNKMTDTSIVDIQLPGGTGDDGVLAAGITTIIPVWIRGDKIGKHTFRFLFGYQSEDENDKIGYRKLQYSVTCQVLPSLKINAFTRPSTSMLTDFILGIEIENLQGSNIKLRQFTSISPVWKIAPAHEDMMTADNDLGQLKGKQTSFAYFRFTHDKQRPSRPKPSPEQSTTEAIVNFIINENQPFVPSPVDLNISNVALQNEQVVCNTAPFNTFCIQSRSTWRAQSLAMHYSALPAERLSSIFTLYFTDDADIVLFWEAPPLVPGGSPRFGHHFIIGINLSLQSPLQLLARIGKNASNLTFQSRSLYAATVSERKTLIDGLLKPKQKDVSPIRLILESERNFADDFENSGDLILSFSARLRNSSWENTVSYSLELPSNESNQALENDFTWIGNTILDGKLAPEEDVVLSLRASFSRRGTFDVNRWRLNVTVHPVGKDGTALHNGTATYMQIPNLPYLISIN
ncbi:ER-golgi trafficking TRAPP I complex 85 kDa subunit-domain-containing protein [Obelidium mucronatum]|nr:ER-golgi trafficking TRAPP I complex 85 kDa subunit-domain-containing protein [Obelidium mucronatum]